MEGACVGLLDTEGRLVGIREGPNDILGLALLTLLGLLLDDGCCEGQSVGCDERDGWPEGMKLGVFEVDGRVDGSAVGEDDLDG